MKANSTKKSIFVLALVLLVSVLCVSCVKNKVKCTSSAPYYCEEGDACCKYQYYDGHGTCWETMSGCRSTGYPCTVCWKQD